MAELRGWDRERLQTAPDADVAAARWIVYARSWQRLLRRDITGEIDDLTFANASSSADPKAVERRERQRRLRAIEGLKDLASLQSAIRVRLGLDPTDAQ